MKKSIIAILLCIIAVFILVGATSTALAVLVVSPNKASYTHIDESRTWNGTVQCQSSYVENGMHAVKGYLRFTNVTAKGTLLQDSGNQWTPSGSGPNDKTILTKKYQFIDVSIVSSTVKFEYGFSWYPDGASGWPVSIPDEPVTY